jgi:capsular exopolysaccharide synthesis family protein
VQQESEAFNIQRALGVARHRLPLIALCVLVAAGAAFGFSKHQTKKYTASVSLDFETNSFTQQIAGLPTSTPNNSSALLAQEASNVEHAKSAEAAVNTARLIGHGLTPARVINSLEIAGQGESPIVAISAKTASPGLSAAIANTYANQVAAEQQSANLKRYKAALAIVRNQLAELSPLQRVGADGLELQNRAQTLSLLSELKAGDVRVASEALPPSSPSSPRTSRNTALGAFLGLLIGLGLVLALERIDRRIRTPEDLEAAYHLPLLGAIPRSGALTRAARDKDGARALTPPAESEQFNLIRARLRYFNIDRDVRTVMVASAEAGDGKSMVACHLAEAAASSGSRVLLVEIDLRQPTLARQLALPPGPGLSEVLIGATSERDALRSVDLESEEDGKRRTLDVLTAGALLPPNPAELLESQAVDTLLARAKSEYDLVVIDTPPLTAVSDAFALLTKVDGIVVVGRIGASRRNAAERLHQVLSSSGASLLGVIANCSKSIGSSVYAYYGDPGRSSAAPAPSANGASAAVSAVPPVEA